MQRKIVAATTFLAILSSVGCLTMLPPQEPPPYDGVELTVACPPGVGELVRIRSRAWAARQRATVTAVEYQPGDALAGDVWVVATPQMPRWAAAGTVVRLPEAITRDGRKFEWQRLLPEYRSRLLEWDREAFAVPLAGESPVCLYRSDLYTNPDVKAKYHVWRREQGKPPDPRQALLPPQTWDEFATHAEFFRDRDRKPSLPPLPQDEAELDRLFYTIAASYARRAIRADREPGKDHLEETFSFHFDQKTGEPRIATPGFVAALALLQRLSRCSPGLAARPEEAFARGEGVLCVTSASWLPAFQRSQALRDRVGTCQPQEITKEGPKSGPGPSIPGADRYFGADKRWTPMDTGAVNRVPYLGASGWLAMVPPSKYQEAALDLLEEMAGPAGSRQTALEPLWGGPTRTEHLSRDRWDSYDLDLDRTRDLKAALNWTLDSRRHSLRNPVVCLRTPNQQQFRSALVEGGLRPALLGKEPADKALAEVERRWKALIAKQGKDVHLREYRVSLGLRER